MIVCLIKSVFGPELYKIYKQALEPGRDYKPNKLEFYSSSMISFFRGLYVFCKWTSPVILAFAYYRGYFSYEGLESISFLAYVIGSVLICIYAARGLGRCSNLDYKNFIEQFAEINKNTNNIIERKAFLLKYDFEMAYWKPDFVAKSQPPTFKLCVNSFGLRMAYPGIILGQLINKPHLIENRKKFIEKKRAKRVLIQTCCKYKNKIDTLFVDQRNTIRYNGTRNNYATLDSTNNGSSSNDLNGNYLVICCDGNASFYEVGIFQIPIENGYSTLGWNYPGFAQSTGLPYPEQLTAAADAVMHYAFDLGFKCENIILFSWSIGGFAVSWLSSQYPDVKAVVLDACFDDITPLAQQQMPKFATDFVAFTIKHNLNLNVSNLIGTYSGPVQFIRRTQDEIISTIPRVASTNRGNDLLLNILRKRYPFIITDDTMPYIRTWLSAKSDLDRARIFSSYTSDLTECELILANYLKQTNSVKKFPLNIGSNTDETSLRLSTDLKQTMALYLADKYLVNFESSHCTPLPKDLFGVPWNESDLMTKYKY